jgi:hypothetical protein
LLGDASLPLTSDLSPEENLALANVSAQLETGEVDAEALLEVDGDSVDLDVLQVARQAA